MAINPAELQFLPRPSEFEKRSAIDMGLFFWRFVQSKLSFQEIGEYVARGSAWNQYKDYQQNRALDGILWLMKDIFPTPLPRDFAQISPAQRELFYFAYHYYMFILQIFVKPPGQKKSSERNQNFKHLKYFFTAEGNDFLTKWYQLNGQRRVTFKEMSASHFAHLPYELISKRVKQSVEILRSPYYSEKILPFVESLTPSTTR